MGKLGDANLADADVARFCEDFENSIAESAFQSVIFDDDDSLTGAGGGFAKTCGIDWLDAVSVDDADRDAVSLEKEIGRAHV